VPDQARIPAPYIRDGNPVGCFPYCLPAALSAYNLLPHVRAEALQRFAADHIAWQETKEMSRWDVENPGAAPSLR
jgi:hypothetical protein